MSGEEQTQEVKFDYYELTSTLHSLIELLSTELELLDQMKIQDLKPMQVKKQQLAFTFEQQQQALRANPQIKARLSADQTQDLRKLAQDYEALMNIYQEQLFKTQQVNEATIEMIAKLVKEHSQRNNGYGRTGSRRGVAHMNNTAYASSSPALKFNQQI